MLVPPWRSAHSPPGRASGRPGGGLRWLARAQNARRRLRLLARSRLERLDHRLGDARAGGGRPQPARSGAPAEARRSTSSAATRRGSAAAVTSRGPILALEGAGVSPRRFAGRNLVAELRRRRRGNGSFENWPNATAFAVLALRAAGAGGGPPGPLAPLAAPGRRTETAAGGSCPARPATPTRPAPCCRRVSADRSVRRAIRYLRRAQVAGGGFRARRLGRRQFPVDRLGGPGDAGRRGAAAPHPRGRPRRPRLPLRAPIARRPLPLLEAKRPDADLGDGPSPGPALRQDLPA